MPMFEFLRQPYPFSATWRAIVLEALLAAGLVTGFIFVFRPFGTEVPPGKTWLFLRVCVYFGLVTLVVSLAWGAIMRQFPRYFNENHWTVGKSLLSALALIMLIGFGNLALASALYDYAVTWRHVLAWQVMTLAVGIFPTLVGVFLSHVQLLRRYSTSAHDLSGRLATRAGPSDAGAQIELSGTNQGELLRLRREQLMYIEAADNYVEVFFTDEQTGAVRSRLLRSPLRRLADTLTDHPDFFRCHRTYLVNLARVERVSGNAQGLRLHLAGTDQSVPVSRGLTAEVQRRLNGV